MPVEFRNLPPLLDIVGDPPDSVDVRVRGSSALLSRLDPGEVVAVVDLQQARPGSRLFHIRPEEVRSPYGVEVAQVVPGTLGIELERTARRAVVVIVNDAAYGAEVHQYAVRGVAEAPMLIDQVDFAALGRGLGAQAAVIEVLDDLEHLRAWLDSGVEGVFVADCRVSQQVVAPYIVEIREAAMRASRTA